eukprot:gene2681-11455_t
MPRDDRVVYRGINVRVSKKYVTRTLVVWASQSSNSTEMDAAKSFMKGSGSFFIVESCTAADITA